MEHLHHFGLSEDPFRNEPLMRFFLETRRQKEALQRLERGVRQAKGLSVLIGEAGSGKTMAVRQLLDGLEEEVFEASMMVVLHGAADATWLLTRFAKLLGVEDPPPEREGLIAEIYERLAIVREDGRHAVLIVDDAQAFASRATLAEICGLLKLEYEERRLLSLVLAGTPRLAQALAADSSLSRRVDVKVTLEGLDAAEAAAYLSHRVRSAGGHPAIIDEGAAQGLHELGLGIPGRMNTLADNALFEAFLCGRDRLTRTDVERAHRDLGWEAHDAVGVPVESSPGAAGPVPVERAPDRESAEIVSSDPLELEDSFDDLDSELEAVFEPASGRTAAPGGAPPKEEEPGDLLVELLD